MKVKKKDTLLFPNTKTEAYVVRLKVEKKNLLEEDKRTIFVETPFSLAKRVGLLAILLVYQLHDKAEDFEEVLKGFIDGRAEAYMDSEATTYRITDKEYLTDHDHIQEAKQSGNYYTLADTLSPFYKLIGKQGGVNYLHQMTFLRFRNYDEEFAALLGSINELVLQGQTAYVDEHLSLIFNNINLVFLMGYPPRPMIASA